MEPAYPFAEVFYRGSLVCEARYERDRWLLVAAPEHFLEALPVVVDVREMVTERLFPAQVEQEFGDVYVREVAAA